ncbi:hypothetical protein F2Q68_00004792 [Brassica cretica]|uniref:Zinc knuckle CX2CX4HX4C domain-containing protein n=1 Tax=Brassica cretica TaxID=69181 RepID=A0A8S9JKL5_BRACR|nr:hypothetical protein F2Q68_00004792 [Brassica cretica]
MSGVHASRHTGLYMSVRMRRSQVLRHLVLLGIELHGTASFKYTPPSCVDTQQNNLKEIGSRLGHVHQDTIELIEGRMLLDIDSRRPLKFARKDESPEGDEVTIEIKYEMLFKHCSTCGMLTHEKEYCPSLHRQGVFVRVQIQEQRPQQQLVKKELLNTATLSQGMVAAQDHKASRFNSSRYDNGRRHYDLEDSREAYKGHADRIIRRRDEPSRRMRYGGSRVGAGPYDRHKGASWREIKHQPRHDKEVPRNREERASADLLDGSYGHQACRVSSSPGVSGKVYPSSSHVRKSPDQKILGAAVVTRRIASAIVTPSRSDHSLDGNVTKRLKGTPRSLAFDTLTEQDPKTAREDDQVIEALNDMDITDQIDGGLMDCEMQNDDLMGLELAEMEDKTWHDRTDHGAG